MKINLVSFDEKFSDKIVLYEIFYNVNYRVKKIIAVHRTTAITSVEDE